MEVLNEGPQADVILFGEVHGVKENAGAVADIIRQIGLSRVSLEVEDGYWPPVLAALQRPDPMPTDFPWNLLTGSVVSIDLIRTLHALAEEGGVDAFYAHGSGLEDEQAREQEMADRVLTNFRRDPQRPLLVLCGNFHAAPLKENGDAPVPASRIIARQVPATKVISARYLSGSFSNGGRIQTFEKKHDGRAPGLNKAGEADFDYLIPRATPIDPESPGDTSHPGS